MIISVVAVDMIFVGIDIPFVAVDISIVAMKDEYDDHDWNIKSSQHENKNDHQRYLGSFVADDATD